LKNKAKNKPLIVVTAPSGAGKTSITNHLLKKFPELAFSVSATTRPPRKTEQNGVDYYFIDLAEFQKKIEQNEFVEWEMVYEGKYYGTLKSELERIWKMGKVPILDIDVQGAIHVKQQYPQSTLSIFIEPPTVDVLRHRLQARATETPKNLEVRINKAGFEMSFKHHFNYLIVNDDLDAAKQKASTVVSNFLTVLKEPAK